MWLDEQGRRQVEEHLDRHGAIILDVPVPSETFVTPDPSGCVPLRLMHSQGLYVAATPAEVRPVADPRGTPFDSDFVRNGWRVLALPPMGSLEEVLAATGQLLLIDPVPASRPQPGRDAESPPTQASAPIPRSQDARPVAADGAVRVPGAPARASQVPAPLARYCRDLTSEASEGRLPAFAGRDGVIDQAVKILLQKEKNCPCLVGEPGVGKSAIVDGIAMRGVAGHLPERLQAMRVLSLDLGALLAGASHRGEAEERFRSLLEALATRPEIVLFVDEIHVITEVRGEVSLVDLLKPPLARGLRLMGATTQEEYRAKILADAALARRLEPVVVPDPTHDETREILQIRLPALEAHHGVRVPLELLDEILLAADTYLPERREPDRSLTLLDRAMAAQTLARRS